MDKLVAAHSVIVPLVISCMLLVGALSAIAGGGPGPGTTNAGLIATAEADRPGMRSVTVQEISCEPDLCDVQVVHGDCSRRDVRVGDHLVYRDVVRTGYKCEVRIRLDDRTLVLVLELTEVKIAAMVEPRSGTLAEQLRRSGLIVTELTKDDIAVTRPARAGSQQHAIASPHSVSIIAVRSRPAPNPHNSPPLTFPFGRSLPGIPGYLYLNPQPVSLHKQ